MKASIYDIKFVSIFVTAAALTGITLWVSLQAISGGHAENRPGSCDDYQAPSLSQSKSEKLIGTWTKEKVIVIESVGQSLGGDDWRLTVTFTDDGRFVWDSIRPGKEGGMIDDSVTGKYSIERGFLIAYRFDKPSVVAIERLPELFEFWPNQLLGRHTFSFEDDCLILGFEAEKTWFYLKKSDIESD